MQENETTEKSTKVQDHEALEMEPTVRDTSQEPDKEFTEVDTRKREKKNAPPGDEQQHKKNIKHWMHKQEPNEGKIATQRSDAPRQP